ncbi:MAG: RnfABCDGE type electron transport complex subunit G [Spirochaetes bacterium]|nr:RnfABCDGE type electron transport complex subunit G [Spirochaetota bacterium]
MKHILKLAFSLFLIAAFTTAALGLTHWLTLEPIAEQARRTQERTIMTILPQATGFNQLTEEMSGSMIGIFEVFGAGGNAIGYIVELAPAGYGGAIYMMVGILIAENQIAGVRILRHTETPGLGSHIVRERFYGMFNNRALTPLNVVRAAPGPNDIEALTAATITTRAITDAVNEAIHWYNTTRDTTRDTTRGGI